jgi:hypothetical protein
MLIPREKVNEKVNNAISKYALTRKIVDAVKVEIGKKGFAPALVRDIFKKLKPPEVLSETVLILFVIVLYDITKDQNINPDKLFNPSEITIANELENKREVEEDEPLEFKPALKINDDQFVVKMSTQEIMEKFVNKNRFNYNPETQREMKVKILNGEIIETPTLNNNSVDEMRENILDKDENKKQISNTLTFNIRQNEKAKFKYFEKDNKFIIYDGDIDVCDGWHRLNAIIQAYLEDKNVSFNIEIRFTFFSTEKANRFIRQEDKRNKIDKTHIKSINTDNYSNILTKFLNEDSSCVLKGQIVKDKILITNKKGLVLFDKVMDTIQLTFNPKSFADKIKYDQFLINGLNSIVRNHPEFLENTLEIFWIAAIVKLFKVYSENPSQQLNISLPINEIKKIEYFVVNKNLIKKIVEVV